MSAVITQAQREGIDFLTRTVGWDYWPYCPVKRQTENAQQIGTCYDDVAGVKIIYLKNLFQGLQEGFKDCDKLTYPNSYEAVLDGWVVD